MSYRFIKQGETLVAVPITDAGTMPARQLVDVGTRYSFQNIAGQLRSRRSIAVQFA